MHTRRHKPRNGWLQLLRPPNLLTVPGDPVAGFLLASAPDGPVAGHAGLLASAVIALLFYMAGMVSNDCFDRREDSIARPQRPIPSGAVSLRDAAILAVLLFAAGLTLAAMTGAPVLAVALVLVLFILAYNGFGKNIPVLGPFLMGGCRGTSLLLGAAATGTPFAGRNAITMIAAAGLLLYIAAVTSLAARETERRPMPFRRWLPAATVACCMSGLYAAGGDPGPAFVVLAFAATLWPTTLAWRLSSCPEPNMLIPSIGAFLRGLLLMQAAWMTLPGGPGMIAAVMVLCAWPASVYLSRWFYAS
jgi:hypothetical protein